MSGQGEAQPIDPDTYWDETWVDFSGYFEHFEYWLFIEPSTPEGTFSFPADASLEDVLGNRGADGSLAVPSPSITIDVTPPAVQSIAIVHNADSTITLTLTASEAVTPPTIELHDCPRIDQAS